MFHVPCFMKLIVGLGNPGLKYKKTRHNVGFQTIDKISAKYKVQSAKLRFSAELFKREIGSKKVILAKPQTFMNRSGESIKTVASYYKIKPENIWVIHDDIDLPLGTIRISQDGTSGGHKGIQSIINHLKTKNFPRFRIGIRPIGADSRACSSTEKFVLKKFTKAEEKIIKEEIKKTAQEVVTALKKGLVPSTILLTSLGGVARK